MDLAESVIEESPDSALSVLSRIDKETLGGNEERARYALLMSMALDKNYIDTTTFDVLQPALDYYMKDGTPDDKLRTYYYQGRIYQNRHQLDSALICFVKGSEFLVASTDTTTKANLLVAQGTIYYQEYKFEDFTHNNLEASSLYDAKDDLDGRLFCLSNVLDGSILTGNKYLADSTIRILRTLVINNTDYQRRLLEYEISYICKFGDIAEIREFTNNLPDISLLNDEAKLNVVNAYSKIGEPEKAVEILEKFKFNELRTYLKYHAVSGSAYEAVGDYKKALNSWQIFYANLDSIHNNIFKTDLMSIESKHELEVQNLKEVDKRKTVVWIGISAALSLVIIICFILYRNMAIKRKKQLIEQELRNQALAMENIRHEKIALENERESLLQVISNRPTGLSNEMMSVIRHRLEMLNSIVAKDISDNGTHAKMYDKWIATVRTDKKSFLDSTRIAFSASHPKLMEYLSRHGLTEDEVNYIMLYAIGLRGKEIGEYIQLKRHYVMAHEIRQKLGLEKNDTNLGQYIQSLMRTM